MSPESVFCVFMVSVLVCVSVNTIACKLCILLICHFFHEYKAIFWKVLLIFVVMRQRMWYLNHFPTILWHMKTCKSFLKLDCSIKYFYCSCSSFVAIIMILHQNVTLLSKTFIFKKEQIFKKLRGFFLSNISVWEICV